LLLFARMHLTKPREPSSKAIQFSTAASQVIREVLAGR
jgi:hypothetical protein